MSVTSTINFCETIGGVAVSPQPPGYQANLTNDGNSDASLRYICAFSDQIAALTGILEAYSTDDYQVGMQHPQYTGLFADSVKVTTLASPDDPMAFTQLDVHFKPMPNGFDPNSPSIIYTDDISLSGEVVPLLKNSVTFADGTQVPNDADYLMQYLKYTRTIMNVRTVNLSAVSSCVNKANSTALTVHVGSANSYTVDPEFAVYMGIDNIKINYTHSGSQRFDVAHSFLISPINVNYQYNPNHTPTSDPAWQWFERVTPKKYDTVDMSVLGI